MKCPICEKGTLKNVKTEQEIYGVALGSFPALKCSTCKESFTDSKTTRLIEKAAKKKGLWELGAKTKITKTGNSLAIRIPKKIADYLKWRVGRETYIHPDKDRLVIEPENLN